MVNRYLYAGLGEGARRLLAAHNAGASGVRARLKRRYAMSIAKALLYPIACRSIGRRVQATCPEAGYNCTWCRCHASFSRVDAAAPERSPVTTE